MQEAKIREKGGIMQRKKGGSTVTVYDQKGGPNLKQEFHVSEIQYRC